MAIDSGTPTNHNPITDIVYSKTLHIKDLQINGKWWWAHPCILDLGVYPGTKNCTVVRVSTHEPAATIGTIYSGTASSTKLDVYYNDELRISAQPDDVHYFTESYPQTITATNDTEYFTVHPNEKEPDWPTIVITQSYWSANLPDPDIVCEVKVTNPSSNSKFPAMEIYADVGFLDSTQSSIGKSGTLTLNGSGHSAASYSTTLSAGGSFDGGIYPPSNFGITNWQAIRYVSVSFRYRCLTTWWYHTQVLAVEDVFPPPRITLTWNYYPNETPDTGKIIQFSVHNTSRVFPWHIRVSANVSWKASSSSSGSFDAKIGLNTSYGSSRYYDYTLDAGSSVGFTAWLDSSDYSKVSYLTRIDALVYYWPNGGTSTSAEHDYLPVTLGSGGGGGSTDETTTVTGGGGGSTEETTTVQDPGYIPGPSIDEWQIFENTNSEYNPIISMGEWKLYTKKNLSEDEQ